VERLAAHDASLRILGQLRARAYRRLERLAPAGLGDMRTGDLLSRLVADVDGLVDLWPRVVVPVAIAGIVCTATVWVVGALVPAAGLVLAVTLVTAAVVAPWVARTVSVRSEDQVAPLRGGLAATALDLLQAAPELVAAGADGREISRPRQRQTRSGQPGHRRGGQCWYRSASGTAVCLPGGRRGGCPLGSARRRALRSSPRAGRA
jgi:ABC-type transport system involved in cytochrome bd biosynthesis fused ATPase/permease subunit